jgi:aminomethyltransferase
LIGEKTMRKSVKKTRLHGWHVNHGANMAIFGSYDMPLWYPSGAEEEHLVVLTRAGIFDTSHMNIVTVKGSGARDLLQVCFSKDLAACIGKYQKPLTSGKSVYGVFLNESGEVIDDAIVFQIDAARVALRFCQGRQTPEARSDRPAEGQAPGD